MAIVNKTKLLAKIVFAATFLLIFSSTYSAQSSAYEELERMKAEANKELEEAKKTHAEAKKNEVETTKKLGETLALLRAHMVAENPSRYRVGNDFTLLPNNLPAEYDNLKTMPRAIVVTHFFTYPCHLCWRIEPYITSWRKTLPDNVKYVRLPSTLSRTWMHYAQVYFALEMMDQHEIMHEKIVNAIANGTEKLNSLETASNFLGKHGVDEDQFRKNYASFSVQARVRKINKLERELKLPSMPKLMVNGAYLETSSTRELGAEAAAKKTLDIVNYLISVEQEILSLMQSRMSTVD